ncbi:hypothetical protein M2103_000322 [Ereboglobus sp. PH5-5]|uniref:hypothetical protein n=1 Tax=Ereboglobus sp. PH5-5 TaxID=2940529 RepID=UPI0024072D2C|nr:hypothetical protein [Ereboglobus sp. PH5-5]MDF9832114.1 hypothetical protein [Ereboglobus sp. PH5-5]
MREKLLAKLQQLHAQAPDKLPVVTLDEYFSGNTEEGCIAPNQVGYGRPSLADLYKRFQTIEQRPEVQGVFVGMHSEWDMALEDSATWPAAENIHILANATQDAVAAWIDGLEADGVIEGWPYGEHPSAPKPKPGFQVFTVCWD